MRRFLAILIYLLAYKLVYSFISLNHRSTSIITAGHRGLPSHSTPSFTRTNRGHDESIKAHNYNDEQRIQNFYPNFAVVFLGLPAMAELLPYMLGRITDFSVEPIERQYYIIGLLLLKRAFIYSTAFVGLDWFAKRSISDGSLGLGERFRRLNEEIFDGLPLSTDPEGKQQSLGTDFNTQAGPLMESLDEMEDRDQALALPVLVGASLVASFAGLKASEQLSGWLTQQAPEQSSALVRNNALETFLSQVIPLFTAAISSGVCTLFAKVEIQRLLGSLEGTSDGESGKLVIKNKREIAIGIAAVLSSLAVVNPVLTALGRGNGLWPVANIVNLLVGATISRAFKLPTLPVILLALTGLVAYDTFFVLGTQALTDGGQGIMEAVAMEKLQSGSSAVNGAVNSVTSTLTSASGSSETVVASVPTGQVASVAALTAYWKPGLLQVNLNGKVSDSLGLGDVIFPSLLAGWALRYDTDASDRDRAGASEEEGNRPQPRFYSASLGGYALGCLACELFQTGEGQPALLYVVPAMVTTMAAVNFPALLDGETRQNIITFQ